MHCSVGVFQGSLSNQITGANRRVLCRMMYLKQKGVGGAMCLSTFLNLRQLPGGDVLKEFLGGDLPLGPWNP